MQTSSRASWRGDMFGVVDGVLTLHMGDQGVCLPLANVEAVYDAKRGESGSHSFLERASSSRRPTNTARFDFGIVSGFRQRSPTITLRFSTTRRGGSRRKSSTPTACGSLLPEKFTLSELQTAYETVLSKPLDKRNFRKKILALGLVTASGEKSMGGRHRPAMLYRFESKTPELVEVF